MKDKEITRLEGLLKEAKNKKSHEEDLLSISKDENDRDVHLAEIQKLECRIVRLSTKVRKLNGTYEEYEDTFVAPEGYCASEEEYGFGFFRTSCEEE